MARVAGPCNAKHGGYFCAKPEGHGGPHRSCGGVEWSERVVWRDGTVLVGSQSEWGPLERALETLMSDLSEYCYCAGWLDTCEHDVWAMLVGDRDGWGMCSAEHVRDYLTAIWAVAERAGVWIVWDSDEHGTPVYYKRSVPLDEWREMYAAWKGDSTEVGA